ncbi:MAG: hypothetical protein JW798_08130 [Prolixibacteraceae bacterium]|nr:hypothetical protein [Prolixibacteraceae bacterium]
MRNYIKIIAFLFLAFAENLVQAQEIKPMAMLDSSVILIGDQVHLRVQVEYPADFDIQFPTPADSLTEFIEILDRSKVDSVLIGSDRKLISQEYLITSFDTGQHVIPSFWFNIHYQGLIDSVPTNQLMLHVFTIPKIDSLMGALQGPIDIKSPYEAPITIKEVAPWILGGLLAFGLIFLLLYSIKRKKNNQPLFSLPSKPKEPAHVVALRELDRIKDEKIWQQGKIKLYYSEITEVLRRYIEERFEIPALEQTSDETIAAFRYRRSLMDEKSFENLKRILIQADLVKFAKFEPMPDDNNLALVDSYFFINKTKVVEVQEVKEPVDDREGDDVILK